MYSVLLDSNSFYVSHSERWVIPSGIIINSLPPPEYNFCYQYINGQWVLNEVKYAEATKPHEPVVPIETRVDENEKDIGLLDGCMSSILTEILPTII